MALIGKGVYTPLSPSNYCSINSFWFSDTLLGWAAGWTGADLNSVFLNYKNGSWEISNTWPWPRNAIHSLYFDDVDHGWECGYGGYFNLGGQSIWEYSGGLWTKVKRTNDLPSSMFALNPSLIYAGAKHGNIFKYNGEVWGLCNSMMDGTVDVCFPDVNNGWAIGETDEIWHYQISKWHRDTSFKGYSFTKVHFYNENIGCASAINEEDFEYSLFVYRNGEWNFREKSYDWIKDMCTTSDGSVWVLDPGNYDTCIVYRLYDTEIDTYLFPRVHFNEIDFPGLSHGWAVGWERINTIKRGVIYKFENGIWNLEQLFNDEIEMISMCDTGYGWAVGGVARDHVIYEYDNREWTLFSDIRYYITDIDCLDREHSYMTTWGGDMLSYNGSEWTLSSIVRDRWLNSVSFPEPGKGWIGGNYGGIFEVKYDGFVEVTELNNPTVDFDITIFPNPAYDNINIRVTGPEDCKISGEIISLTGCVVLPIPVNNFAHNDRLIKLNIESLKMGIYILNIKTDQQVCSKKIIVL